MLFINQLIMKYILPPPKFHKKLISLIHKNYLILFANKFTVPVLAIIAMDEKLRLKNSIMPLIIASKIFGVFPIKLKISDRSPISVSIFGIIHSIFSIILILYFWVRIYNSVSGDNTSGLSFFLLAGVTIPPINAAVITISFICHIQHFSVALKNIFEFSPIIKSDNFFRRIYRFLIFILVLTFIFPLCCEGSVIIKKIQNFNYISAFVLTISINFFNNIVIVNLWFFVILIILFKMFNEINDEIGNLNAMFGEDENLLFEFWHKYPKNYFLRNCARSKELCWLIDLYGNICDTCNVANKCFGLSVAAFTVYIVFDLAIGSLFIVNFSVGFCQWRYNLIIFGLVEYLVLYACQSIVNEVSGLDKISFEP